MQRIYAQGHKAMLCAQSIFFRAVCYEDAFIVGREDLVIQQPALASNGRLQLISNPLLVKLTNDPHLPCRATG